MVYIYCDPHDCAWYCDSNLTVTPTSVNYIHKNMMKNILRKMKTMQIIMQLISQNESDDDLDFEDDEDRFEGDFL